MVQGNGYKIAKGISHMRMITLGLSALAFAAVATPALAQDAPASDLTVTGGATLTTDYRFRGISQTNEKFAVQGTLGVSHSSGLYVGVWGSSIDDYVAAGSDQEIDLYAGYKRAFGAATFDIGVLYYYYPGSGGVNTDFVEPYVSVSGTVGPVSAKVGAAYAPKQKAIVDPVKASLTHTKDDNLYVYGDLSGAIPGTPLTLTGHLGHSWGTSYLATPTNYTDWSVGASYTWNHLTFGVSYVDTDYSRSDVGGFYDAVDATVLGSVSVAF
jgi:uncharacterized protein (TIGR02001 family)